jgi:hypothetical protein
MAYIQGEGRSQGTLFPVVLDDLVPSDHMCRVIDAFVGRLDMDRLGFERAAPADIGRPGYDPRVAEAVSLLVPKSDSFLTMLGGRVPSKRLSDVASRPLVSGSQEHRRVSPNVTPLPQRVRNLFAWYATADSSEVNGSMAQSFVLSLLRIKSGNPN